MAEEYITEKVKREAWKFIYIPSEFLNGLSH
jgi:hypothetical protein